jgi:hypothetical protein
MTFTNKEAQVVLGMANRGDNKHDIAAWFGVNQARIAEVEQGSHGSLAPAAPADLYPKGAPGPKGIVLRGYVKKALAALAAGDSKLAEKELQTGLERFNKNET